MEADLLDAAPVWDDLQTFDGSPWRGVVDWLIGGIPCQSHSVAGKKRGAADERNLWPDARRVIGKGGAEYLTDLVTKVKLLMPNVYERLPLFAENML